RIAVPNSPERLSWKNIRKGFLLLGTIIFRVGIFGSYRSTFWKMALPALKRADIEGVIHVGLIGHHLIEFARECSRQKKSAAFYAQKPGSEGG
ncbi:MAG TPA: DUF4070 domain-containing protein, partial [Geobacteraceae bacterium]|nr:DUF4070 domain-containing protein [Geobacteraceae bacterium]